MTSISRHTIKRIYGSATITERVALLAPQNGEISVRYQAEHEEPGIAFGFEIELTDVSPAAYFAMPGSVYAGNRFRMIPAPYPCLMENPEDWQNPDLPNTISNIPRLRIEEGFSRIQQLSGDLAAPAIGVWLPSGVGIWLLAEPQPEQGQTLFEIEESEDRKTVWVRVLTPGVREGLRYGGGPGWTASTDVPASLIAGEGLSLRVNTWEGECADIPALWDVFLDLRTSFGPRERRDELPWSEAFRLCEAKHNAYNWDEKTGYYAVGERKGEYDHWQMGWVGGGISAWALHCEGSDQTRARAERNFDWIAAKGQAPSGLFWSFAKEEFVFGDMVDMSYGEDWHLIRRSGDGLYFLTKLWRSLPPNPSWQSCLERCADGIEDSWVRFGQHGQFVSDKDGTLEVWGTTSGGICPAGLALASLTFGNAQRLNAAVLSAKDMHERFVKQGYTSGGPGEALQCPDSESAFGLLESLVTLYELTQDQELLKMARHTAALAISWVMPYDFRFPASSTFGRLDMRTTGSVWANSQNKHSAPGICTLSGQSLLRLYRFTGDRRYLDVLTEIAHGLTQYLSREDRPVFGMPSGFMCERVNTCDWEEPGTPVGEGFAGGCWCEVSTLLTYAELPGIYVDLDDGHIWALDNVQASWEDRSNGLLKIENPTQFPATVRILAESSEGRQQPLGIDWRPSGGVLIEAGESVMMNVNVPNQA